MSVDITCFLTGGPCAKCGTIGATIRVRPHLVFVGMPFDESSEPLYTQEIEPAIREVGLEPWRADRVFARTDLACKVCETIQSASLAVLDISTMNPNVLFELGLVAGFGRPFLLLIDGNRNEALPQSFAGSTFSLVYRTASGVRGGLSRLLRRIVDSELVDLVRLSRGRLPTETRAMFMIGRVLGEHFNKLFLGSFVPMLQDGRLHSKSSELLALCEAANINTQFLECVKSAVRSSDEKYFRDIFDDLGELAGRVLRREESIHFDLGGSLSQLSFLLICQDARGLDNLLEGMLEEFFGRLLSIADEPDCATETAQKMKQVAAVWRSRAPLKAVFSQISEIDEVYEAYDVGYWPMEF